MNNHELDHYQKNGYILVNALFDDNEISLLSAHTHVLMSRMFQGRVLEENGVSVRSMNGPHLHDELFKKLASERRLLGYAKELIGGDVYVHQYKINTKEAFTGESWDWHSDHWFWKKEDGMREPKALTAMLFLDDINEFNGPMFLIPNTQNDTLTDSLHDKPYQGTEQASDWEINTSKVLKYQISHDYLRNRVNAHGMVSAKGKRGSVLFFHSNLLHCSCANPSPWERKVILISYNHVDNVLDDVSSPRPEFMASHDRTALTESSLFEGSSR